MNPTSNKKDFDELSTALKDMAYSYIEKYSPSKQQLKVYLMKKVLIKFKTTKSKKEISELIDNVLVSLEQNKFLNDELYSDSKSRTLFTMFFFLKVGLMLRESRIFSILISSLSLSFSPFFLKILIPLS